MPSLLILTGPPGTGKTTLAARLAAASPRGLHLPSDVFYTFPAHPLSPYRPESKAQNTDIVAALTHVAGVFASRGWDVVLDGIFGPWFLPLVAAELRPFGVALEYVVLRLRVDVALERVRARSGFGRDHVVAQMHAQFADLGPYERHAVDATDCTPDDLVAEVTRRRAAGGLILDVAPAGA